MRIVSSPTETATFRPGNPSNVWGTEAFDYAAAQREEEEAVVQARIKAAQERVKEGDATASIFTTTPVNLDTTQLSVTELRVELRARGLATTGGVVALRNRLEKALIGKKPEKGTTGLYSPAPLFDTPEKKTKLTKSAIRALPHLTVREHLKEAGLSTDGLIKEVRERLTNHLHGVVSSLRFDDDSSEEAVVKTTKPKALRSPYAAAPTGPFGYVAPRVDIRKISRSSLVKVMLDANLPIKGSLEDLHNRMELHLNPDEIDPEELSDEALNTALTERGLIPAKSRAKKEDQLDTDLFSVNSNPVGRNLAFLSAAGAIPRVKRGAEEPKEAPEKKKRKIEVEGKKKKMSGKKAVKKTVKKAAAKKKKGDPLFSFDDMSCESERLGDSEGE